MKENKVYFPRLARILATVGENIKLPRLRRRLVRKSFPNGLEFRVLASFDWKRRADCSNRQLSASALCARAWKWFSFARKRWCSRQKNSGCRTCRKETRPKGEKTMSTEKEIFVYADTEYIGIFRRYGSFRRCKLYRACRIYYTQRYPRWLARNVAPRSFQYLYRQFWRPFAQPRISFEAHQRLEIFSRLWYQPESSHAGFVA